MTLGWACRYLDSEALALTIRRFVSLSTVQQVSSGGGVVVRRARVSPASLRGVG